MKRKIAAIIVLGLVLLACLLACGYFGIKTIKRTRLRHAAMTAYENKEYLLAERLLQQYVKNDPNAEAEFVALANIYHTFGDTGLEAQMWQKASSLNPLNAEYHQKLLDTAGKAASYELLYSILGLKVKTGERLVGQELYLYVIASCRVGHQKKGEEAYKKALEADPEIFHQSDLGRFAEFLVTHSKMSKAERSAFLDQARKSADTVVRFEAIYICLLFKMAETSVSDEELEILLNELVETNYFSGTPILADYDFSQGKFDDVIALAEAYLNTIDSIDLYLLYAESCTFVGKLDELKALEKKLRKKSGTHLILADYCNVLISFLEDDGTKLVAAVRNSGNIVTTPLSLFIRLRVAVKQNSFSEILTVAHEIFSTPPFHDLRERAMIICIDYLAKRMQETENQNNPSQMAELAKILTAYAPDNNLLTQILLLDQYKKGLAKESDLMAAVDAFPEDRLLIQIASEFLLFEGKAEQALPLIEQVLADSDNPRLDFLYMLILDQLGRHDEASEIFRRLVEQSEFDLSLLANYFEFCRKHERRTDLASMADKLENATDSELKPFANIFRAAALFTEAEDNEEKKQEALKLLAASSTDNPDFALYVANRLCEADMLDEAEAKYKALLKNYKMPGLILVNLSEVYKAKGEEQKALEVAMEAYSIEKQSMLPAFIYAKRLSEAKRYEEAVDALKFPHHAVNYREDVVELWTDCMHHVIENSIAGERYMQAEEQCLHLLTVAPDDEFGKENLEKVRELMKRQKNEDRDKAAAPAA